MYSTILFLILMIKFITKKNFFYLIFVIILMVIYMNNQIKYPNGMKKEITNNTSTSNKNHKKARLGTDFENIINESNNYYLNKGIAAIYKKPTPIQIVKVDYPSRNKAKITEAYYKVPSTTDYNGIYKGKYIDFEAKSCHATSFSFEHIYEHQIKHLDTVKQMGGISFLLIEFVKYNEVFLLESNKLIDLYNQSLNGGRKSIPYKYFKDEGHLINKGFKPRIDYLSIVDKIYF